MLNAYIHLSIPRHICMGSGDCPAPLWSLVHNYICSSLVHVNETVQVADVTSSLLCVAVWLRLLVLVLVGFPQNYPWYRKWGCYWSKLNSLLHCDAPWCWCLSDWSLGYLNLILEMQISVSFYWLVSSALLMIISSDECHRTLLMISQHWFR